MPPARHATLALAIAVAAMLAATITACNDGDDRDVERPRSLVGTWVGRAEGMAAVGDDSIALTLAGDATASVRRWAGPRAPARFDSTAQYALWKTTGSPDGRGTTICLHLPATGANDCIPIRSRGGDSLRLAFPTRPSAPGAVVDVTLWRASALVR